MSAPARRRWTFSDLVTFNLIAISLGVGVGLGMGVVDNLFWIFFA